MTNELISTSWSVDPQKFAQYVSYFAGTILKKGERDLNYFYQRDASLLAVVTVSVGKIVDVLTPELYTETRKPNAPFQDSLIKYLSTDRAGHFIMDVYTGAILAFVPRTEEGKIAKEGFELNWELFDLYPKLNTTKILTHSFGINGESFVVSFTDTTAPLLLSLPNHLSEFIEPLGEPTVVGVGVVCRHLAEMLGMKPLPLEILRRNFEALAPTGYSILSEEALVELRKLDKQFEARLQTLVNKAATQKEPSKLLESGEESARVIQMKVFSGEIAREDRSVRHKIKVPEEYKKAWDLRELTFVGGAFHCHFNPQVNPKDFEFPKPEEIRDILEITTGFEIYYYDPQKKGDKK